ncbi:MAG: hypothetical protein AAF662_00130 [Pseudomonadota bacterium]
MSFLSDLLKKLKGKETVDYTHRYIGDDRASGTVKPDEQYVRVWLRSAKITEVRRWTKKFHAAVHAQFTYTDRDVGKQEVMAVVAPDKAFQEMDPKNLDRFIVVNQPLLGPIPYRGELGMDVALFSISAADLAKPYLNMLAGLTETASVAFLAQAKPFVDTIRTGAEALLGDDNQAELEIGLTRTDTNLRTGNILVARVEKGTLDPSKLRIDPTDFKLIDAEGKPVDGFPYMILGIEAHEHRDDYASIPEIRKGWDAVSRAGKQGDPVEKVKEHFAALRRIIWFSNDLIRADKSRIVKKFERELAGAGYDLAAPAEFAALESNRTFRPLRDASEILAPLSRPVAPAFETAAEAGGNVPPRRISMAELQAKMADLDIPDAELRQYFVTDLETSRPFSLAILPDPDRVEIAAPVDALEGAMVMSWAIGLCRLRRQRRFRRRRRRGDERLVLVSEGDSWYQFPLFLDDVIDQVMPDYNIWSVGAAGDTLQNMVLDNAEYLRALDKHRDDVKAFLFSGGGNDIVGEDEDGNSIIAQIVKPFEAGRPPEWYVDNEAFAAKLRLVDDCYRKVIQNVTAGHPGLPIVCHGYDHAIPGGFPGDERDPFWAKQDQWIGRPLREDLGITDHDLQREIVSLLINRLNELQKSLCGGNNSNGAFRNAWHVDVRGIVAGRWADELHPSDEGFKAVGDVFRDIIASALGRGDCS